MVAIVVVLALVVALLTVLVAGLLRSHADILKALHDLGVGVGEPSDAPHGDVRHQGETGSGSVPITMGPPLPPDRDSTSAPAIAGNTPRGDALAIAPGDSAGLTLLAFLSSGCSSCAGFWKAFQDQSQLGLPTGARLVVVTKGPDREVGAEVAALASPGLTVVMSSEAWTDYEVPGSPFFVLVDGSRGRRIGEGVANRFSQVAELVRRAQIDAAAFTVGTPPGHDIGLDGPARESANDAELRAAGVLPGDESLYPTTLADLYGPPDAVDAGDAPTRPQDRLTVATMQGHGISAVLPAGFEGRIFRRPPAGIEQSFTVAQFATFPLPGEVGDFGGGAVNLMGDFDIFATLFEYGPESLGTRLFARGGVPRALSTDDFLPYLLRRGLVGQAGTQWFFTEGDRPFTLYVVLGSFSRRAALVPRVNDLLLGMTVHSTSLPANRGVTWN